MHGDEIFIIFYRFIYSKYTYGSQVYSTYTYGSQVYSTYTYGSQVSALYVSSYI